MLNAFKSEPYDFEAVYHSWPKAPIFQGRTKKDGPVDVWLAYMKEGCRQRKVPKHLWHVVAEHYIEGRAKTRFEELKMVLRNLHGGKYKWTWKKLKVAMRNMSWDIRSDITQLFKIGSVPSGYWWVIGKGTQAEKPDPERDAFLSRALKTIPGGESSKSEHNKSDDSVHTSGILRQALNSEQKKTTAASEKGFPSKLLQYNDVPEKATTTTTHVPIWLLHACHSIDVIVPENPKAMTTLAAVLVTVGSIPMSEAVQGTFLAGASMQAIGTMAVGIGNWIEGQHTQKLALKKD